MSKKHFIALADTIREANRINPGTFSPDAIASLARYCSSQNYRFNRQRWEDYIAGECGPNGGAVKS